MPFCDELVKNSVQRVSPLVFVHANFSSAAYPDIFPQPSSCFVLSAPDRFELTHVEQDF